MIDRPILQTVQQRANTLFARDVMWPSVPEKCVIPYLSDWRMRRKDGSRFDYTVKDRQIVDCKTIACFGGWVAVNPYFRAQGVYPEPQEFYPQMRLRNGHRLLHPGAVSMRLFGVCEMFEATGWFSSDRNPLSIVSDHEAVLARLDWLVNSSVVVGARSREY